VLKVNQVILVDTPSTALENESGIFEVVSPLGDVIRVTCVPGLPQVSPRHIAFRPEKKRADLRWEVRKIAELPGGSRPAPGSPKPEAP
jgi:hypothetical protein